MGSSLLCHQCKLGILPAWEVQNHRIADLFGNGLNIARYVSKPNQRKEQVKVMEEVVTQNGRFPIEAACSIAGPEILDLDGVLARLDGDQDLLRELIDLYLEDSPRMLQEVRAAVALNNPGKLKIAAHTLKGAVGNFGAQAAVHAAQQLESMSKNLDLSQAPAILAGLEESLTQLRPALES